VVEHVLMTKLSAFQDDIDHFPMADVFAVAPDVLAHAVKRPFIDKLVRREIDAFLALEGKRTLRELLVELGILDQVRGILTTRGSALLQGAAKTPEFASWVGKLLA
jgi:hypothetical protein